MRKPVLAYANNKGADQPAHPRSLISAFVVCFLDSITSLVSLSEISRLSLASEAEQADLSPTWFSHDGAHFVVVKIYFQIKNRYIFLSFKIIHN